jgi:putative acetyltransferase
VAESLTITHVTAPTDELVTLLEALDLALGGPYLPSQRHALSVDQLFAPNTRFFVARVGNIAVGCGGVAFDDGYAEIKRMFTRTHQRRTGVAKALLEQLEREARAHGYSVLRLETGCYQAAAIAFYERAGFERRDAFGAYSAMSPQAIETSVFYQKSI